MRCPALESELRILVTPLTNCVVERVEVVLNVWWNYVWKLLNLSVPRLSFL